MTAKHTAPTMREALRLARATLAKFMSAGHNLPEPTPEEIEQAFWVSDAALSQAEPEPSEPKDEPVAWRVTYADGGTVYLHHKPSGDSGVYECTPLYTAPPAPAGGVERLLAEMQPHIDKIERCADVNDEWGRVVTGQTDAAREIARIARAALNGGREKGK